MGDIMGEDPTPNITTDPASGSTYITAHYTKYVPDFLMVDTPYQFPKRFKDSLASYAGRPSGTDPTSEIQDIFFHPEKYGFYNPTKTTSTSSEDEPGLMNYALGDPFGMLF